jgi:isopenicillin N synthase-like dioxygenase
MTRHAKLQYAAAKPVGIDDIPVIDLRETGGSDPARRDRLLNWPKPPQRLGFFYVTGHGVPRRTVYSSNDGKPSFLRITRRRPKHESQVNQFQRGWMRQGLTHLEGSATHDAKEVFFWGRDVDRG